MKAENWDRPIELIKVKEYKEKIFVDKCCAEVVKKIDSLKDTYAVWCCCNHGLFKNKRGIAVGGVEFKSKLHIREFTKYGTVTLCKFGRDGQFKRYNLEIECKCSPEIIKKAKKHFRK